MIPELIFTLIVLIRLKMKFQIIVGTFHFHCKLDYVPAVSDTTQHVCLKLNRMETGERERWK